MEACLIVTYRCNAKCYMCNTWKHPSKRSKEIQAEIIQNIPAGLKFLNITGGEPFLASELTELTSRLKEAGAHITIETAATVFKPVSCDLVSLSPKLSNSTPRRRDRGRFATMHEERRLNVPAIQQFIGNYDYQLKFVVEKKRDLTEIQEILEKLRNVDPSRVFLMAQAVTRKDLRDKGQWIVDLCKGHGYRYSPRLHIELFGNRRGT